MSLTPHVSVVVPTYDRAAQLPDAVDSVLAQRGIELECVVVDDGSTDDTLDVVREIARRDARVVVVERPNGGPSAARNSGIARARAELVTFLDSDDVMPPGRLARQRAARAELEVDGVFGRFETAAEPGGPLPDWLSRRPDWLNGWAWTSVMVARRSLEAIGGFDEELRWGEDLDLVVRLRGAGCRVVPVEDVFVLKRWFGDNLTTQVDDQPSALGWVVRRHLRAQRRQ